MVKYTQSIRRLLPTNCLSVFDHFVGLALKVSKAVVTQKKWYIFYKILVKKFCGKLLQSLSYIRDTFKTQSNICYEAFGENS